MNRTTKVALAVAIGWASTLCALAAVVPWSTSETTSASDSSSGPVVQTVTRDSSTLLDDNGPAILLVIALPLAVSLIVAACLWCHARVAAWTITGPLCAFNVLAMASIGVFLLPMTVALVVACSSTKRAPRVVATPAGSRLPA